MTTVSDLASAVRSKNAGPFQITFDLFFDDPENYATVRDSGVINPETIAELYDVPEKDVLGVYHVDTIAAIKFSIKRPIPSGHPSDSDIYSAQQHSPLLDIEV